MKPLMPRLDAQTWSEVRPLAGFLAAMMLLQFSQVLLYPFGVDASPYAFATGQLKANSILGISIQTWAFGILGLVCAIGLLPRWRTSLAQARLVWGALVLLLLITAVTANSFNEYLDGMGKLALPVVVYLYLSLPTQGRPRVLMLLMTAVNIFTVGQVLVCFLTTGSFANHIYYHELSAEYFGFYHHPFAMSGVLGSCAIVAAYAITNRMNLVLNGILLVCDLALIYLSQVRTYTVAVGISLAVVLIVHLFRIGRRRLGAITIGLLVVGGSALVLLRGLGSGRVTEDPSSGRLDRWLTDLTGFINTASPLELLIGGGPQYVLDLNARLIGVRINSLNILVDNFINLGIVGSILFLLIWVLIVKDSLRHSDALFVIALCLFVTIASMLSNMFDFPITTTLFATALLAVARRNEVSA